jgi:phage baseplate assembly protein W
MPIPQTIRVNPLDLQKNIAIGVSLPFDGPGVFNSTYTTKDQVKSNLVNLLLTDVGERVMNPNFGCDLRKFLFEGITDDNSETLINSLTDSISVFVPQVTVREIILDPSPDSNSVNLTVNYILNISNTPDEVTVQFQ